MELKEQILKFSRTTSLSPAYEAALDEAIDNGRFASAETISDTMLSEIVADLTQYREQTGMANVVIGMSGGLDSALTAALFKRAYWNVIGVTMPIHQEPSETDRGIAACDALGIEHRHVDLTELYDVTLKSIGDDALASEAMDKATKVRRGNIRARLRMVTLYNLANSVQGLVASTDNLSELALGFWTLHGDVGDLSPIQSLNKSWEVPYMASVIGVPESIVFATPTDGLGIDAGDEAQLGASYLEMDLALMKLMGYLETDIDASVVRDRLDATWFKRFGAINLPHPIEGNWVFDQVKHIENYPPIVKEWINS